MNPARSNVCFAIAIEVITSNSPSPVCPTKVVCAENSNSDIIVVQSTEDRMGVDTASSLNRNVRTARPCPTNDVFSIHYEIIGSVGAQNPPQAQGKN